MTTAGSFEPAAHREARATALRSLRVSRNIGTGRGGLAARAALFVGDFVSPTVGDTRLSREP